MIPQQKMKYYCPLFFLLLLNNAFGQNTGAEIQKTTIPIVTSINFQAIATPFHNLENNLRNPGLRIGSEFHLSKKRNTFQTINLGFYNNKYNGGAVYASSEFMYRPKIYRTLQLELKFGLGIIDVFLPTQPYVMNQGKWEKAKDNGNWNITVNTGFGFVYKPKKSSTRNLSPFIQYDIMGIVGYNKSIPVLPTTFLNMGCRFEINNAKK